MDMGKRVAGGIDVEIDGRSAGGTVGVVGVAGIQRDAHGRTCETTRKLDAVHWILVLDVFDDEFAADVFGTLYNIPERRVNPIDDARACAGIDIEIVVIPRRVGRMDDHLCCTKGLANLEPLKQTLGHDRTDQRVLAVDLEAPERPVNAKPAFIAVEK